MSIRSSVVDRFQSATQLFTASRASLDAHGGHLPHSLLTRSFDEIRNVVEDGAAFSITSDIRAFGNAIANAGGTINDRLFLLEKVLHVMATLPKDSIFGEKLHQFVIDILYKDLPHPPCSYLALPQPNPPIGLSYLTLPPPSRDPVGHADYPGQAIAAIPPSPVNYAYRAVDGSYYNPLIPTLGMAGSPYARTVPSLRRMSPAALPPADLVFDRLLKRDKFVEHRGGISSLFFAFADIIIHNAFNTDNTVPGFTINKSSSYLDLSPLYGTSQEDVDRVRLRDGTGRLKEDVFADPRMLNMPPAVCALLVIFNRNHNYVAEKILSINEYKNFKPPPHSNQAACDAQDEEIFQRARLVNTGYFVQVILRDYVGAILGLVRDGSAWRLDPLLAFRDLDHEVAPRGQGNVVSIEFNLLYRWHATVSEPDTYWTEQSFKELTKGADPSRITVRKFLESAAAMIAHQAGTPVTTWTFGGIKRDEANGRFCDADLAKILQDATQAPAADFGARGTPEVLRVIEILSIEQGRKWGVCTLNEFRKFIGLDPYESFEKWNKDPRIANAAEALYHHIDNLELHVGLQAEEVKNPMPGAGLCPGYTISRAILADAVALTRGDRFLTVDFTPHNLTTWGYDDCQANTSDGSYGGMLTKLLFRHLPDNYPARSAYAHFPFLVPKKMKEFATKLPGNIEPKYEWDRPHVPVRPPIVANRHSDVKQLLAEPAPFTSGVAERLRMLTLGVQLNIGPVEAVLARQSQLNKAARVFSTITKELINETVSQGGRSHLDIVGKVINFIPVRWLSNHIIGLPLKIKENPRGTFTEGELYTSLANIANYVYCNTDRSNDWFLHEQSQTAIQQIKPFLRGHLARLTRGSMDVESLTDSVLRFVTSRNDQSDEFLTALVEATGSHSGNSALDGLAGSLLAAVVPTAALFSKIIAQVVDFYLDEDRAAQREQIVRLAEAGFNEQIMPFIFEALRLNPPLSSVFLEAQSPVPFMGDVVSRHQHIIASIINATLDPSEFENPDTPNYARPAARAACVLGLDRKGLLSPKLFERVAPVVLLHIFSLKHLCRYPPGSGPMPRCQETVHGVPDRFYTDMNGRVTPFPVSRLVQFEG